MVSLVGFGPAAQTPDGRAEVLARMKLALPRLRRPLSPYVQQLHEQYLAGELTWLQVCLALSKEPLPFAGKAAGA